MTSSTIGGPADQELTLTVATNPLTSLTSYVGDSKAKYEVCIQQTGTLQVQQMNDTLCESVSASVPEHSSSLSLLAIGTLGAASILKRKLKNSKSPEKTTEKVG